MDRSCPCCDKMPKVSPIKWYNCRSDSEFFEGENPDSTINCGFLQEYCQNTSIHGVKYIGGAKVRQLDRWWWIISFVVSLILCSYLIGKLWTKWQETPVIVTLSEYPTGVWEIPFPAVTICPVTKAAKSKFNFSDVYKRAFTLTQSETEANITAEEMVISDSIIQTCVNHIPAYSLGNNISDGRILVNFLKEHQMHYLDFKGFQCLWKNLSIQNCSEILSPVLTEEGICFTFNTPNQKDVFRVENLHKEYKYIYHARELMGWSLEKGYTDKNESGQYPYRLRTSGTYLGLTVLMPWTAEYLDYICGGPVQGFKIHLHTPGEVPRMSQNIAVPINQRAMIGVKPKMMSTSEGLKDYNPNRRQCYFKGERYLKFFQLYTQQNCELECLSNYTMTRCGCVKFSMPRDGETPVCGAQKMSCYIEAEYSHLFDGEGANCNCLPDCSSIAYEADSSQAYLDLPNYLRALNREPEHYGKNWSSVTIHFKETQFITSKRSELYGRTDFLANCGGLLGLFMGVSLLSIVEILYYVTIRLCLNRARRTADTLKCVQCLK